MSDYYNQRVQPLKALYDKISTVCKAHIAVAGFDCGDLDAFGTNDYTYPLVYLETINAVNENQKKNAETYSIAINIVDRYPIDQPQSEVIKIHDKVKQIFQEIKAYLELKKVFGNEQVSPAASLLFNDFENDKLVRFRGEFTIEVELVATMNTDLAQIFPSL